MWRIKGIMNESGSDGDCSFSNLIPRRRWGTTLSQNYRRYITESCLSSCSKHGGNENANKLARHFFVWIWLGGSSCNVMRGEQAFSLSCCSGCTWLLCVQWMASFFSLLVIRKFWNTQPVEMYRSTLFVYIPPGRSHLTSHYEGAQKYSHSL